MKFAIEYEDIELMADVMSAIGEVYVMFGDLKSAINTYNCIVKENKIYFFIVLIFNIVILCLHIKRLLADMTHNLRMKVDCLVYLSGITKKLKLYT